jgi:preprotein translocase subunit SecD
MKEFVKNCQQVKQLKAAVESGYANSYSAIFDSNITTFFTGNYTLPIWKRANTGICINLMIGIVCSLFSALSSYKTGVRFNGCKRQQSKSWLIFDTLGEMIINAHL